MVCLQADDVAHACNNVFSQLEEEVGMEFDKKTAKFVNDGAYIKFTGATNSCTNKTLSLMQPDHIQKLHVLEVSTATISDLVAERVHGAYIAAFCLMPPFTIST